MDAVYHPRNVLPIVDIGGFWIKYLEDKEMGVFYTHFPGLPQGPTQAACP